mgnify:FL=1|tara:strand:+ start:118 stop:300 length:183 start_codon:yes stop_codon:yes gene_type:complete
MAVKKKIEQILSKTDIDERLEKWANERRNNLSFAIDQMPYVCAGFTIVGFISGTIIGYML